MVVLIIILHFYHTIGEKSNFWPIIEKTPAGVSLHYIDSGIDTGKIISQKKVFVEPVDTKAVFIKS